MRPRSFKLRATLLWGAAAATAVVFLLEPAWAQVDKKTRNANYTKYVNQLTARFNAWDLNGDNVLDKTELAKAFRGPNAKPFDDGLDASATPSPVRQSAQTLYVALLGMPMHGMALNQTVMAVVELRTPRDAPKPAVDYTQYPDYQFLVLAGTKGQTQLSKQEFTIWARTYAGSVADADAANRAYQAALKKYNGTKNAKAKAKAQADAQRAQQTYQTATAQLSAVPAAIHQALGVLKR